MRSSSHHSKAHRYGSRGVSDLGFLYWGALILGAILMTQAE